MSKGKKTLVIGFTGHRDRRAPERDLDFVFTLGPGMKQVWVQGCAEGFDTQVKEYAKAHGIMVEDEPPDFEQYGSPQAYFVRNRLIVDVADLVVACYDGRERGGTFHALNYARKMNKMILFLRVRPL